MAIKFQLNEKKDKKYLFKQSHENFMILSRNKETPKDDSANYAKIYI